MKNLLTSVKVISLSLLLCCVAYPLAVLVFAQLATPHTANGSLIGNSHGEVVGSLLVAQNFSSQGYFWPRPSAVDFNASAAGGSNLAPGSPAVTARAALLIARYGATKKNLLPADLVTASGSGLDPHISIAGAKYQVARVASARKLDEAKLAALVDKLASAPGGVFSPKKIVNVLELNMAVDSLQAD